MYRQGDVLIVPAKSIAGKEVQPINGRLILGEGEATGHAHVIDTAKLPRGATARMLREAEREFLSVVGAPAVIEHEEHAPVTITPGDYEIVHQREYTPEEIRRVAD